MRLRQAVAAMHAAIDGMLSKSAALSGTESHSILEAYQMFAKVAAGCSVCKDQASD